MNETVRVGFGSHYEDQAASLQAIPQTAFLVQREFCNIGTLPDCLVVATTEDSIEDLQSLHETEWTHVRFEKSALQSIWGETTVLSEKDLSNPSSSIEAQSKLPRGRRPKYNWEALHNHLEHLWNHHGPLDESDPEWGRQADVEEAAKVWFVNQIDDHPASSTIRDNVSKWLKRKNEQAGKGR